LNTGPNTGNVPADGSALGRAIARHYRRVGPSGRIGFAAGRAISESMRMAKDDEPTQSPRGPLMGLLITALLVAVGLWLAHALTNASKLQDCVMSGRSNCNPIDIPAR
jgi:hypothetical protein